jgi:peptidyl-prolyl cis-trans isomerase C
MLAAGALAAGALAQSGPVPPGAVGMGKAPASPDADPVVAEVEGQAIHLSDVGDVVAGLPGGGTGKSLETVYPAALRLAIEHRALVIRAHADGLAADAVVRRHMQQAADRVLEDAYLHRETGRLVTDEMLSARYDAEIRGKPGPEEVHAQVILVPTEAEAEAIIAQLAAGADFATLARQSSKDASAASGGDLGFVRRDGLGPEIGAVLFALGPASVTPYPVSTQAGWFVLRAVERRRGPTPTFAEVHDRLLQQSEHANLAAVVQAAMSGMTIRSYDMSGH